MDHLPLFDFGPNRESVADFLRALPHFTARQWTAIYARGAETPEERVAYNLARDQAQSRDRGSTFGIAINTAWYITQSTAVDVTGNLALLGNYAVNAVAALVAADFLNVTHFNVLTERFRFLIPARVVTSQ